MRKLTEALFIIASSALLVGCPPVTGNDQLRIVPQRVMRWTVRDHPGHFGAPGTSPPLNDIHTGTDGSNIGARINIPLATAQITLG